MGTFSHPKMTNMNKAKTYKKMMEEGKKHEKMETPSKEKKEEAPMKPSFTMKMVGNKKK